MTINIVVGGVSYLGHQNTKKCTINEMQMIGFEKTSRPFGFDDALDQGLCRGLMCGRAEVEGGYKTYRITVPTTYITHVFSTCSSYRIPNTEVPNTEVPR